MWSLHLKKDTKYELTTLVQPFSDEEWNSYPFASEEKLKWWRAAKLGLFLHVGISALGKVDIGWSRATHKLPDPAVGKIPDEVYDSWAKEIEMKDFCAEEWLDLAEKGGFKYIVIITKHHDGFHMWDTDYSDYKITKSKMGRDYLRELVDACHKRNMPVGLYYSQRDWTHPDYEPIDESVAVKTPDAPFYELKPGCEFREGKNHRKYVEYMHNAVCELMEKYGKIDVLWWDASWYRAMFTADMWDSFELEKKVRERQPHILINNRAGLPGDFDTPECIIGNVQRERPWETCMPMGNEWAWTGRGLKSFKKIIEQFVHTVCGDGNYLLSIGCMPNGKIAPEETDYILKLGDFTEKYAEAIYDTRSGPWNPGLFGGSVYRDNFAYVHIVNRPENGKIILPLKDNKIKNITTLTEKSARTEIKDGALVITVDEGEFLDIILRLEMQNNINVKAEGIDALFSGDAAEEEEYVFYEMG